MKKNAAAHGLIPCSPAGPLAEQRGPRAFTPSFPKSSLLKDQFALARLCLSLVTKPVCHGTVLQGNNGLTWPAAVKRSQEVYLAVTIRLHGRFPRTFRIALRRYASNIGYARKIIADRIARTTAYHRRYDGPRAIVRRATVPHGRPMYQQSSVGNLIGDNGYLFYYPEVCKLSICSERYNNEVAPCLKRSSVEPIAVSGALIRWRTPFATADDARLLKTRLFAYRTVRESYVEQLCKSFDIKSEPLVDTGSLWVLTDIRDPVVAFRDSRLKPYSDLQPAGQSVVPRRVVDEVWPTTTKGGNKRKPICARSSTTLVGTATTATASLWERKGPIRFVRAKCEQKQEPVVKSKHIPRRRGAAQDVVRLGLSLMRRPIITGSTLTSPGYTCWVDAAYQGKVVSLLYPVFVHNRFVRTVRSSISSLSPNIGRARKQLRWRIRATISAHKRYAGNKIAIRRNKRLRTANAINEILRRITKRTASLRDMARMQGPNGYQFYYPELYMSSSGCLARLDQHLQHIAVELTGAVMRFRTPLATRQDRELLNSSKYDTPSFLRSAYMRELLEHHNLVREPVFTIDYLKAFDPMVDLPSVKFGDQKLLRFDDLICAPNRSTGRAC